jgi:hypothetical protein
MESDKTTVWKAIESDVWMIQILRAVRSLALPDGWVAGGFIRNKIWDMLHGYEERTPLGDVDVVYFDLANTSPSIDPWFEEQLASLLPGVAWSVKNQARMHSRSGDAPYTSVKDALSASMDTASAVAARLTGNDDLELLAPYGFADLIGLIVRPTPHSAKRLERYRDKIQSKDWLGRWPKLEVRLAAEGTQMIP